MNVCIAGKNNIAVEILDYLLDHFAESKADYKRTFALASI
jgi:hypothetical protein